MSDAMQEVIKAQMQKRNDAIEQRLILGIERGERHVRVPRLPSGYEVYCLHAGPCEVSP